MTPFQNQPADSIGPSMALGEYLSLDYLLPRFTSIAVIVLVAFIGHRVVKIVIRRLVNREIDEEDAVVKRLREQRLQTFGGIAQSVAAIVITILAFLTILGEFVEIGPMLAGIGVLGLAISFGAQSLVKDIISGTFILLEGQFAVGDVVRIGDTAGLVEKIKLRTVVLRDIEGIVHIIPNGEITRVSNLTKTWSRAVLDIGVAYKEDVDRVIDVLGDIGRQFHQDEKWGAVLVEPPEIPGVEKFGDSAVVIRMMVKTLPLQQWNVMRELRRRIKNRFDREGIEIPFPHLTFYWGDEQLPPALGNNVRMRIGAEAGSERRS